MFFDKRVLVIAAHVGDETACAGTIAKIVPDSIVHVLCLADTKEISKGFATNETEHEFYKSCESLGVQRKDIMLCDFPVKEFCQHRAEIFDLLYSKANDYDIILFPSMVSGVGDNEVLMRECLRAFAGKTLLAYEMTRMQPFNNQMYVALESKQCEKKFDSIRCYKTVLVKQKDEKEYMETIDAHLKFRGGEVNTKIAECFEVYKLVQ